MQSKDKDKIGLTGIICSLTATKDINCISSSSIALHLCLQFFLQPRHLTKRSFFEGHKIFIVPYDDLDENDRHNSLIFLEHKRVFSQRTLIKGVRTRML